MLFVWSTLLHFNSLFQNLERLISQTKHTVQNASLAKHGALSELNELIRTRTELECLVVDLRAAGERAGGKREELEGELEDVEGQIEQKETELADLIPEWETHKERESTEKRNLDHARSQLQALYGKQGRVNQFRTKAERDSFLRHEIASIESYKQSQGQSLESSHAELATSRRSLQEIEGKIRTSEQAMEAGRDSARDLLAQIAALKNEASDLTEQRKELWREDTKLQSLVTHASEELRTHERSLASMMDKVREPL